MKNEKPTVFKGGKSTHDSEKSISKNLCQYLPKLDTT